MFTETTLLKMRDGLELHLEVQEVGSPVWIVAVHGIGEHLGRHRYIREMFGHDFNICQMDLRGHGKSHGKRAWVESFDDFMLDLKEILEYLQKRYRMGRFILFGHSMGALICSSYIQRFATDDLYPERLIINAPPCGAHGMLGKVLKVLPGETFEFLTGLSWSFPVGGLVDLIYLSHDPKVKENYINDELCSTKLESKLIFELMKCAQATFARPLRSRCDSFVTVGSHDRVIGKDDVLHYFSMVDKSFHLKIIDGAYHEIHNEIEKYRKPYFDHLKQVMNEVIFQG